MILARRLLAYGWIAALLVAVGFLIHLNLGRIEHVERISRQTTQLPSIDPTSPTGYAGGVRVLIAPGHNNESYQWIVQTQQMISTGQWRLRQVDYDNAPIGRPVRTPSLYRWWLAGTAWVDHVLSDRPIGLSVEQMALWADPLLFLLFLCGGTGIAVWRFGPLSAALFPLAGAALYPLGGVFLPGCPDDIGLALVLVGTALLTWLAGALPEGEVKERRLWFAASGVAGGLALWVSIGLTFPLLAGLAAGAGVGKFLARKSPAAPLPWRTWGSVGALTVLAAWLIEYAPAHLDFLHSQLTEVHPFYALAWWGTGELLAFLSARLSTVESRSPWAILRAVLATLGVASLFAAMMASSVAGFLARDTFAYRLNAMGEAKGFENFLRWLVATWSLSQVLAVVLPAGLLIAAGALIRSSAATRRVVFSALLASALVALGFSWRQISWWNQLDLVLLVLLVAITAKQGTAAQPARGTLWAGGVGLALFLPGILPLRPAPKPSAESPQTRAEIEALAERDFSHWLARRSGPEGVIALAPPNLTVSLIYHGGLRGIGSPYRDNEDGFRGSVRIAGATLAYEAQSLVAQRRLTHVVIPSWDDFLDRYASLGANDLAHSFIGLLHAWVPPRWIRPVPYYLPNLKTFADDRLLVFEVTEVQDEATSLSRLTEYFVDMGQFELARQAARTLASDFESDLGAVVAKARTEIASRDAAGFRQSLEAISVGLKEGADESLPWDRRVSLCLVLAQGGRTEEATTQAQRCMDEMTDVHLRSLPEATLFRFLSQSKAFGLQIEDPALLKSAKESLPAALRERI